MLFRSGEKGWEMLARTALGSRADLPITTPLPNTMGTAGVGSSDGGVNVMFVEDEE